MINYITAPFRWFFKLEAAGGLMLLVAAVIALVISNSNLSEDYFNLLNSNYLIQISLSLKNNMLSKLSPILATLYSASAD